MKIAVLTSGGVDSSVALRLLKDQGHEVTAFYLKIWLEDELSYLGDCPWEEDLDYVQKICSEIDVPLEIVPMQKEYWEKVVEYTVAESKAGRTPNPDVLCNQFIKFGLFYEKIDDSFEKVATGHYAQIEEIESVQEGATTSSRLLYFLKRAPDPVKDQTYFLARLSQKQLSRAMFPIGHLQKAEVRELAEQYNLPNKSRKDSQGICFLGKISYREFIEHHLGEQTGDFINQATGEKVGEHKGFWFYTIGQRMGLGLSGGPWFVVEKDLEKNVIYLANGYDPREVYKQKFEVGELLISDELRITNYELMVKIRHGAAMHACTVTLEDGKAQVQLKEPVHGVAAGQFAVFYQNDLVVGSGVIL